MRRALLQALPARESQAVELWLTSLYNYQIDWLLDETRYSLWLKSRQIGASHVLGACGALWGAMLGEVTTVVSVGEREALEVLGKAERHALALVAMGSKWAAPRGAKYRVGEEVRFASGGRIIALPSSSAGRSFSGNVILDEFGYHTDAKKVWDGAAAVVMHGESKLRVASTPNGTGNLWHQLWTEPKANEGYSKHSITIHQAIADGLKVDLAECRRMSRGDLRLFDQLFGCSFLDSNEQYIPTDLITAASVEDLYCYEGECYGGLDIGRTNDRTVLVVVKVGPLGVIYVQIVLSKKRTSGADIRDLASQALGKFGCRRLAVDATGMGTFPAEELVAMHGKHRVEPVVFTLNTKEDLATTLFQRFSDRQIRIPRDDADLRNDLCAVRRIITSAGNVRYDAPVTEDGHADRAWALALAIHAASRPVATVSAYDPYRPDGQVYE